MNRRSFISGALLAPSVSWAAIPEVPAGIILVGASWCSVCKQAAPVLALFAERNNVSILVASADGRPIAPFGEFRDAGTHPLTKAVKVYPTTLIYSPRVEGVLAVFEGYRNPASYIGRIRSTILAEIGVVYGV